MCLKNRRKKIWEYITQNIFVYHLFWAKLDVLLLILTIFGLSMSSEDLNNVLHTFVLVPIIDGPIREEKEERI